MQRDEQAETALLAILGDDYNPATATLSLHNADTKLLSELTKKGWTLYVSSPNKTSSQLYAHHEPSGITWFSSEESDGNTEFAQQLLDGYLHRRNYQESDGHIILFKKEDATRSDDKALVQQLGAPFDAHQLYADPQPLTDFEIDTINRTLSQHLHATLRPYQREGVL